MKTEILKIKELISDEVCMGTYGLVEIKLRKIEEEFNKLNKNVIFSNDDFVLYHKKDNEYVVWIINEMMTINVFYLFDGEVQFTPYVYECDMNLIENKIKEHYFEINNLSY